MRVERRRLSHKKDTALLELLTKRIPAACRHELQRASSFAEKVYALHSKLKCETGCVKTTRPPLRVPSNPELALF
jgi:hypothetical protein